MDGLPRIGWLMAVVLASFSVLSRAENDAKTTTGDLGRTTLNPPATRVEPPATQPKPPAKVAEEAQPILRQLSQAYGRLKSLEVSGSYSLKIEGPAQGGAESSSFSGVYQASNRFRHEVKDQMVLGCTGRKLYAYSYTSGAYIQADAPAGKLSVRDWPREVGEILPMQDPALALAAAEDPVAWLSEFGEEIGVGAAQQIEGKSYPVLRVVLRKYKNEMLLVLDPQTHLIRRMMVDLKPVLGAQGRGDLTAARYTVDYARCQVDGAVKEEVFAWGPPAGAKDLALAAARAKEMAADGESAASALVGQAAPDFTLEDLEGQRVSLAKLKGSVVVLDFWASWCGPCVAALPRLDKIRQEYAGRGLKVYAVNLKEGRDQARKFMSDKNLRLPVLLDVEGAVAKLYGVEGIPTTVIIGKDGVVKKVVVGNNPAAEAGVRELIAGLLAGEGWE